MSAESETEFSIMRQYFDAGHKYDLIVDMLSAFHDIKTSVNAEGLFERSRLI